MTTKKPVIDVKAFAGGAAATAIFGVLGMAYSQVVPANWMNSTQFSVLLIAFTAGLICFITATPAGEESLTKRMARGILHWMVIFATLYAGATSSVDQKSENILGATQLISTEGNTP